MLFFTFFSGILSFKVFVLQMKNLILLYYLMVSLCVAFLKGNFVIKMVFIKLDLKYREISLKQTLMETVHLGEIWIENFSNLRYNTLHWTHLHTDSYSPLFDYGDMEWWKRSNFFYNVSVYLTSRLKKLVIFFCCLFMITLFCSFSITNYHCH